MTDLLNHPLIAQRYFFPRAASIPDPIWVSVPGAQLACAHFAPHADALTVVHFHGNGEVVADYLPDVGPRFLALGVNVFFAEYRGYGESTGVPALGAMLDDVEAIWAHLNLHPGQVVAFGRSVGSLFALEMMARHPDIGGVILESGIADVAERIGLRVQPHELGATAEQLADAVADRLDHARKLAGYPGRLLVLHAERDGLVDISHAEANIRAAQRVDRPRLRRFARGDHNSILMENWDTYWAEVQQFLDAVAAAA